MPRNKEKDAIRWKVYYAENKDRLKASMRNSTLKYKYGISSDDYTAMYKEQKGRCAICNKKCKVLDIDHSHKDNMVRGLLCRRCNLAIGAFDDDITLLEKAVLYLLNYK